MIMKSIELIRILSSVNGIKLNNLEEILKLFNGEGG